MGKGVNLPISSFCLSIDLLWITEDFSLLECTLQNFSSKGSSFKSFTNNSFPGLGRIIFEFTLFSDYRVFDTNLGFDNEDDDPFLKYRSILLSNSFRSMFQHNFPFSDWSFSNRMWLSFWSSLEDGVFVELDGELIWRWNSNDELGELVDESFFLIIFSNSCELLLILLGCAMSNVTFFFSSQEWKNKID